MSTLKWLPKLDLTFECIDADVGILQWAELTWWKCRLENMKVMHFTKWSVLQKPALLMQVIVLPLWCYSSYFCSTLYSMLHLCIFPCLPLLLFRLCQMQHKPEAQVFYMSLPFPVLAQVFLELIRRASDTYSFFLGQAILLIQLPLW